MLYAGELRYFVLKRSLRAAREVGLRHKALRTDLHRAC